MKTNVISLLIDNYVVILSVIVLLVIVFILMDKFNLMSLKNLSIEEDKNTSTKNNFLMDYDIKSAIVGGIFIFVVGFLIYIFY
jgi:hypothetical protein